MVDSTKSVYQQVVQRVKEYPLGVGRSDIARDFSVWKTTAAQHLEKAVQRGDLVKTYGWIKRNSQGWVYHHRDNLMPSEGLLPADSPSEPDGFFGDWEIESENQTPDELPF